MDGTLVDSADWQAWRDTMAREGHLITGAGVKEETELGERCAQVMKIVRYGSYEWTCLHRLKRVRESTPLLRPS